MAMSTDLTTALPAASSNGTHGHSTVRPDVREAALRPLGRPGRWWWLLVTVLSLVVIGGIAAWVVQLRDGLASAGYNDEAFWSIYIADVVTFVGVSYGGAVVSAILRLTGATWRAPLTRLAEGTAVVTVVIGGAFIIPHLGRPERILELITRPNLTSPIFWDFVAVMTYMAASMVFFFLPLVPDMAISATWDPKRVGRRAPLYRWLSRGWTGTTKQRRVLHGSLGLISIMIIPLAVSVHSVLSWAFALVSRPWWHESIWAPYFVVAALYSGVALVILVVAGFRRAYHLESLITERHFIRLGYIMAAFAMAYLYLTFADILPDAYVGEPGTGAVFHELLLGHFALWFWLFVMGGGIIPLTLIALRWTRHTWGLVTAAALVAPSMWLKRMLMVVDPATYDRVTGTFGSDHFTWVAVAITVAGLAAIPLLLMLLFRFVPLLSVDEMEEIAALEAGAPSSEVRAEPVTEELSEDAGASNGRRGVLQGSGTLALIALALPLAGVLVLGTATPSHADTRTAQDNIFLAGSETDGTVDLVATLTTADGAPVAHKKVEFLYVTTEFGPDGQQVSLGTKRTDSAGQAHLSYQATLTGDVQFLATYADSSGGKAITAATTVPITVATSAYHPAPQKPLANVGYVTIKVLLVIVALIWVLLIAQLVRVRRVCVGSGKQAPPAPA